MSEVVVRMEIPESCDVCPCLDDYGDYPRCRISNEQRGYNFPIHEKRMPGCPITQPLPEGHGRLVDMNDVEGMFEAAQIISDDDCNCGYVTDDLRLEELPTIVPADTAGRSE